MRENIQFAYIYLRAERAVRAHPPGSLTWPLLQPHPYRTPCHSQRRRSPRSTNSATVKPHHYQMRSSVVRIFFAWRLNCSLTLFTAAAMQSWRSNIYEHFCISVERRISDAAEKSLWFKFTCKTDPARHSVQYRARKGTSSGTNNLLRKSLACNARQKPGQVVGQSSPSPRPFSPARFRALLALWCARNHRPFELVEDELFNAFVDKLRPGTSLPDSTTISRDVKAVYSHNMHAIRSYFQVCMCPTSSETLFANYLPESPIYSPCY
jgi:hypothetical protein